MLKTRLKHFISKSLRFTANRALCFAEKLTPTPPRPRALPHQIIRAQERYGVALTSEDLNKILSSIQNGNAKFVKNITKSTVSKVFSLNYLGAELLALTDYDMTMVKTFLPKKEQLTHNPFAGLKGLI